MLKRENSSILGFFAVGAMLDSDHILDPMSLLFLLLVWFSVRVMLLQHSLDPANCLCSELSRRSCTFVYWKSRSPITRR